jgi:hypothetical protein
MTTGSSNIAIGYYSSEYNIPSILNHDIKVFNDILMLKSNNKDVIIDGISFNYLKNKVNELEKQSTIMQQMMDNIIDMNKKLNEIYYSPGMPGFLDAEKHFNKEIENNSQ